MNTFEWCVIVVALDIVAYSVAHTNELTTKGYVQRDLLVEPSPSNPPGFDKQDSKSLMQWILKIVDIIEKHCNITSKPLYLATTTAGYRNSTTDTLNGKYKAITGKLKKSSLTNFTGKPVHAAIDTRGFHVRAKPNYTNKNDKSVHLQASMNKSREPSSTTVSHNGLRPTRRIKSNQESEEDSLFDEYPTDPTDGSQLYSTSQPRTTTMSLEGAAFSQLKPGYIAGIAKPIHPSRPILKHKKYNSRNLVNKRLSRPNNRSRKTYKHLKPNSATVTDDHVQLTTISRSIRPSYAIEQRYTFVPILTTLSEYTEDIVDVPHTNVYDAASKPIKISRYMIPSSGIKPDDNLHSTIVLQGTKPSSSRKINTFSHSSAKAAPHYSANKSTHMKANSSTTTNNLFHSTAHYRHTRPNLLKVKRTSAHFSRKGGSTHPYDLTDNSTFTSNSATITDNPSYSTIFYKEIEDITHTHIHNAANKSTKRSRYMIPSSGIKRDGNILSTIVLQGAKPGKSLRSSAKGAPRPQRRRPPHHSGNKSTHMKANLATTANNPSHSTAHYRNTSPNLLKVNRTSVHFSRKGGSSHPYDLTDNPTFTSNSATITDNPLYSTIFYKEIADITHTHIHDAENKSTKRSSYMIPSSGTKRDDNIPSTIVLQRTKPGKSLRSSAKGALRPQRRRHPHHSANKSTHMKANSGTTTNNLFHSTAHYRHTRPSLLKVNRTSAHFSRKAGSTHPYDLTDNPKFTSNSATVTDNPSYSTIFYKEIADITHTHMHDAANKSTKRSRYMIPSSGIKRGDIIPSTIVFQGVKPDKSLRSSVKGAPKPQRRRPSHRSANKSTHMKANSATTTNNLFHSTAHYRHTRSNLLKVKRTSAHFLRKASSTHPHASTDNATSISNPTTTTDNPFYSTLFYKRIKSMTRKNSSSKHYSRKIVPQHTINERPHHSKTNRVNTSTRTSKGRKAIMEPTTMQSSTSTTRNTAIVPRIAETNLTPLGDAMRGTRESTTTELSSSDTFGIIRKIATRDYLNDNAETKSADNTETTSTVAKLDLFKENTTATDASTETGSSHFTNSEDIATTTATVDELNSSFATIPTATLRIRSPCEGKDPWSWLEIFGQEQTFHTKLIALGKKLKKKVALN